MLNPMTEVKQHEYALLEEIAQDAMVTQASLSDRLGIAVGSVNWYIKRLITRGWVKVTHLDRTRLKYDLTPEGMRITTQRAMSFARDSLKVYSSFREKAKKIVEELKNQEVDSVYIDGEDEIMDILRLTCIEAGLKINGVPEGWVLELAGQEFRVLTNSRSKKN
jgi:predicted transcriptional regulator